MVVEDITQNTSSSTTNTINNSANTTTNNNTIDNNSNSNSNIHMETEKVSLSPRFETRSNSVAFVNSSSSSSSSSNNSSGTNSNSSSNPTSPRFEARSNSVLSYVNSINNSLNNSGSSSPSSPRFEARSNSVLSYVNIFNNNNNNTTVLNNNSNINNNSGNNSNNSSNPTSPNYNSGMSSPGTSKRNSTVTMGNNKVLYDKDDPFMARTYSGTIYQPKTTSLSQPVSPSSSSFSLLSNNDTTTTTTTNTSNSNTTNNNVILSPRSAIEKELLNSLLNFPSPPKESPIGTLLPSPRSKNNNSTTTPAAVTTTSSTSTTTSSTLTPISPSSSNSSLWNFASHKRMPSDLSSGVSNTTVIMHRKLSNPLSLSTSAIPEEGTINLSALSAPLNDDSTTTSVDLLNSSITSATSTPTSTSVSSSNTTLVDTPPGVFSPQLNLTSAPPPPTKPMLFYDDDESSSSEEFSFEESCSDNDDMSDCDLENNEPASTIDNTNSTDNNNSTGTSTTTTTSAIRVSSSKSSASLISISTSSTQFLDLNDESLVHVFTYLLAEDICVVHRLCKKLNVFINQRQILWKDLTLYYLKKFQDSFDVNVWDEEMMNQSNVMSLTPIMGISSGNVKVKEGKGRSATMLSKDQRKSVLDISTSVIGKRSTYLPNSKGIGSTGTISASSSGNITGGTGVTGGMTSSASMSSLASLNSAIGAQVMALNSALRRLTPLTSVPPTNEITDFIDTCQTYPLDLLLRKLLQRYLVPRTYQGHYSDSEWKKVVEIPIQLRVGKLLRKVVDHKPIEFDYTSLLILKSFIRGFLLPTSEMAKGLNTSIQKKINITKCLDITKLTESLLTRIFRLLDLNTCCSVLYVCKKWYQSMNNGNVWEHIYSIYRNRLCTDDNISIWDEINPVNYYIDINASLNISTPNLSVTPNISPSVSVNSSTATSPSISISPMPQSQSSSVVNVPKISIAEESNLIDEKQNNLLPLPLISVVSASTSDKDSVNSEQELQLKDFDEEEEEEEKLNQDPSDSPSTPRNKLVSLNQLVEKLTSITTITDISEINACLTTYRTFTSTSKLIYKLLERYHVPKPVEAASITPLEWKKRIENPIQHNVFKVLKKLIDEQFHDFNQDVIDVLKIFLRYIIIDNTSLTNYLRRSFVKKLLKIDNQSVKTSESRRMTTKMAGLRMMSWKPVQPSEILTMPADEIARQLTLIEFEIYSKIQSSEFLNQAWVKDKTKHLAPNIRAAIDRFNQVTKWVCTVIVKEEKIRTRAKYMSKLLKVAKCLRSYSNYHTLMAILSGLNEAPVFRLKHTFSEMKPKVQKLSSELQALMTVEGNHDTYRAELNSIDQKQSCIPYLGVFLKDITFFQESSIGQGDGLNIKQSKNVYGVLKVIKIFQKNTYSFEENSKLRDCLSILQVLDEEELYSLSLLREPRNSKRSDLA